jgi:ABC-type dipeptide/oligopeptide/nickel transport system ATPase subunit
MDLHHFLVPLLLLEVEVVDQSRLMEDQVDLVEVVDIQMVQQEVQEILHPYHHHKEILEEMVKTLQVEVVEVPEDQVMLELELKVVMVV